ncbi:ribonuclease J [Candidatus Mycoplasma haematohominis]|uniref:Ribonuclease J 2 n=1 Tax=Candidatus Mycoplasma haematohominis TaxID=1494318 RepID=A0A478FPA0_9MOLU|nr:ribonuclease J [Candidatus Mycoplasma haemohominis]GCE63188.1 ribonuclease J 2 [Candidatus Mycoplasma haemohominis]
MSKINYFALGGQDEMGRYAGVLEINNEIFILNAGIGAEFSNQLGIKKIIPDLRYLSEHAKKIKGIFIGCPKNINIGSLPYFLTTFPNIPVYTSVLGKAIIESFLAKFEQENNVNIKNEIIAVNPAIDLTVGMLKVCGIKSPSSVPCSYAWVFKLLTGQVVVFLDEFVLANEVNPCCESQLHLIAQQVKNKTSLLLIGAQNAGKVLGFAYPLAKNFSFLKKSVSSTKKRVLVSLYEDDWNTLLNLSRVAKVYSMNFHISCPRIAFLVNKYIETLHSDEYAAATPLLKSDNSLIAIVGNNEDLFAKLRNIDAGKDEIAFQSGDLFLICTITLPENEYEEILLLNDISKHDIIVVKQPKSIIPYAAGNEDIKFVVNALSPYNIVPVNGYYKDFVNVYKALSNTVDTKRIKFLGSGERLEIDGKQTNVTTLNISKQYVNEEGILDINNMILLERQLLEKSGLIIISVLYNIKKHIFYKPKVSIKAFVPEDYSKKNDIHAAIDKYIALELSKYLALNKGLEIREVKMHLKDAVYKALKNKTNKRPVILPLITKWQQ